MVLEEKQCWLGEKVPATQRLHTDHHVVNMKLSFPHICRSTINVECFCNVLGECLEIVFIDGSTSHTSVLASLLRPHHGTQDLVVLPLRRAVPVEL